MALASSADNIRYNGTGRAYAGVIGETSFDDLGELEGIEFDVKVSTSKVKSTRNAARGTILEADDEREGTLNFGLREQTEENLRMALLGSALNTQNQSASYVDAVTKTWVSDKVWRWETMPAPWGVELTAPGAKAPWAVAVL